MVATWLRSFAAVGLLATPVFAHDGWKFPFGRCAPVPLFRVYGPRVEFDLVRRHHEHRHAWTYRTERYWVEAVFERRVVAYDLCGRPIARVVQIRAGHWASRTVRVCRCGERC